MAEAVWVCDIAFPEFPPLLDDDFDDELLDEYCFDEDGALLLTGDDVDDLELDLLDIPAGVTVLVDLLLLLVGLPLRLAAILARPVKGCLLVPLGETVWNSKKMQRNKK